MSKEQKYQPQLKDITKAKLVLQGVVNQTPLMENLHLSDQYESRILLKREDLQVVRSYKIRGAYNKISRLSEEQRSQGIVCASAGNHAQGVAFSCNKLQISGRIYMPTTTPRQKVKQVKMFGKEYVEIVLTGDTFDAASHAAKEDCQRNNKIFIHPFDDPLIIEGQATVGLEILQETSHQIDYLFCPIGGGGLISGVGSYFKSLSPHTKIIGVEPAGAASMKTSLDKGEIITLSSIDKFVDGAAVQRCGDFTFQLCQDIVDDVILVPEGKICSTILRLYNEDAMVVEPAGALSIAALDAYREEIKGKNVVCIVSGSNNDITRMEDIKERSLLYEGLKHYFMVQFPQRAGALNEFLNEILGPNDDITHFAYSKKTFREEGPAIIGIEVQNKDDIQDVFKRMEEKQLDFEYLNDKPTLFQFLI